MNFNFLLDFINLLLSPSSLKSKSHPNFIGNLKEDKKNIKNDFKEVFSSWNIKY